MGYQISIIEKDLIWIKSNVKNGQYGEYINELMGVFLKDSELIISTIDKNYKDKVIRQHISFNSEDIKDNFVDMKIFCLKHKYKIHILLHFTLKYILDNKVSVKLKTNARSRKRDIIHKPNKELTYNFPKNVVEYNLSIDIINNIKVIVDKNINPNTFNYAVGDRSGVYYIFENIYKMLYVFKYTTGEIAECFNRKLRTVQVWLKKCGWELDRFEVQQRIVANGRRNYKEIMNKGRQTMTKKQYSAQGSDQENYLRRLLNTTLPLVLPNDVEIIVGLNNKGILEDGKEIDIPVIIFKNNNIYKFAIEYNGDFWHTNEQKDMSKQDMVINKGYHVFFVVQKQNLTPKQIAEVIENEVDRICEEIKKII